MTEELQAFRPQLAQIVAAIHQATALIAVLSFAGYGLAVWLWFSARPWLGLGIATVSYLFFRLYPLLSIQWARWRLADDEMARRAFAALERAWENRSRRTVLMEVDAWLRKTSENDG